MPSRFITRRHSFAHINVKHLFTNDFSKNLLLPLVIPLDYDHDGKLRFLPLFEEDLNEIVDYITHRLKNPIAADALVSDVQTAIRNRLSCAEAFEQYHSAKERQYPYYRITVRNYTIFYVVMDDVMEVRRIIYSRRDIKRQI